MIRQWVLILSFAGLVLSRDKQNESSTKKPLSSTTTSPPIESTSQKTNENVPIEAQILQKANAAQNSRIYLDNHASSIPRPEFTQPLGQYVQTVLDPSFQYISPPVGYSQYYQHPDQELLTFQQPSNSFVTSELERHPRPASVGYHSDVLYVSDPTGAVQHPSFYPLGRKVALEAHQSLYPSYHHLQEISNPFEVQHVSIPIAQTGHHYETVTGKPSSGDYLAYPVELSRPSVEHIHPNVTPQPVQYVVAPKQIKKIVRKPIKTVRTEADESYSAHPSSPAEAPNYNVRIVANAPSASLYNSPLTYPSTSAIRQNDFSINHHIGLPHVNYAPSSTVGRQISVPVIYNNEGIPPQQFLEVTKQVNSASTTDGQQASASDSQQVPVREAYPNIEARVRYDHRDRAASYLPPTPVYPEHGGYSREVIFSSSPDVSNVRFNGNGIKYGW